MLNRRHAFVFCLGLLALGGVPGSPARAQTPIVVADASAFVDTVGKEAIAAMANKAETRAEMVVRFRSLLKRTFDLPLIGRFVLGRYWNQATPAQQAEYLTQFEEMVVRTYADRFASYAGETFRIASARPEGTTDAFVTTEILRPYGPPVAVEWRVRKRDNRIGIIDVVVEGVSMSVTQRSEFASVIQSKGGNIDGLLQALKEKNAAMAEALK
jgi:phospholipid transport system substrate-binding protein